MAVTSIWKVQDNLRRVYDYTTNPMKTDLKFVNNPYDELASVLNYTNNVDKTEQQYFVTGLNCTLNIGCEQMNLVKQFWRKEGGILAYHGYQSFAPREITPTIAHEVGIKLAQELWGDRFQVIVSTHLNKGHLHNHFVVNSVSFVDGKRFYNNKKNYKKMRQVSDRLCKEHELSVIENPKHKKIEYAEWKAIQENRPTIRSMIREDVDEAIAQSLTYTQFIQKLKTMEYDIKSNVRYMAIKAKGKEKYIRLKSLGNDYTEVKIKERILENKHFVRKHILTEPKITLKGKLKTCKKITGLKALYFKYLYELGIIPKNKKKNNRTRYLKEDILKLDKIIAESRFLYSHDFTTNSQLQYYKDKQKERLSFCLSNRRNLYNHKRSHTSSENIDMEIQVLNKEICQLRKEVVLSESILKRSLVIDQKLDAIKQVQKESEVKKNEHRLRGRSSS